MRFAKSVRGSLIGDRLIERNGQMLEMFLIWGFVFCEGVV